MAFSMNIPTTLISDRLREYQDDGAGLSQNETQMLAQDATGHALRRSYACLGTAGFSAVIVKH